MIIVADSGSTKTDWRIVPDQDEIIQIETIGLNPYYTDKEKITHVFRDEVLSKIPNKKAVKGLYFYGAGCSSEEKRTIVKTAFKQVLKDAEIKIEHDMLGAARATCKKEKGIVAILGTGSNACLYDGQEIINNRPNLGYVLGDEGSGAYMGKQLLKNYFYGDMPKELQKSFEKYYKDISLQECLKNIYEEPFPNRYIANFARFIYHKKDDSFVRHLIIRCFDDFFQYHILPYMEYKYPLHLVGSIAMHFQTYIEFLADNYEIRLGNMVEKPIAGLTLFHTEGE